uniref:B1308_F1_9 n=1 Tax=Mycobacterium leprae TaxID=1769 RepID=Q49661_MYCLR|nr:B1308_F1_9 [Mycobacterium leprae]
MIFAAQKVQVWARRSCAAAPRMGCPGPDGVAPLAGVQWFKHGCRHGLLVQNIERAGRATRIVSIWLARARWVLIAEPVRSVRYLGNSTPAWYLTDAISGSPNALQAAGHR